MAKEVRSTSAGLTVEWTRPERDGRAVVRRAVFGSGGGDVGAGRGLAVRADGYQADLTLQYQL
jgi:hypothetical protein